MHILFFVFNIKNIIIQKSISLTKDNFMDLPKFVKDDSWLIPYLPAINMRICRSKEKEKELTDKKNLTDFAGGYLWYGLHSTENGWVIRDYAPNATAIYLTGSFNDWKEQENYRFSSNGKGNWELFLNKDQLHDCDLYAFSMHWENGSGKRIPAWSEYVVQDPKTLIFNAKVWQPKEKFVWEYADFSPKNDAPLIYECHVGMAGEKERVHTYSEFRDQMLPRIKKAGYNTIQMMAVPEHPYYGSFGYHVSGFFAPSSRFGTPDELKSLIDTAHKMGLSVIMDLVHSHAVKNEIEGLGKYDGTRSLFFHEGERGLHPAWDSYCFDYNKKYVLLFLLSNIRYWMEDFKFDGFRFDGVTSMIYLNHGLDKDFTSYKDYFTPNTDFEALTYISLANKLIHEINPCAISIAEEMSGYPGMAAPQKDGGIGFDYRMAMGVPDFWIKTIKELADEQWDVGKIYYELTSKRQDEKVISYDESHDQALVGDKTIIFRLIDKDMYYNMRKDQPNVIVDRGISLHKMIRLVTLTCAGGGYLNFMGNEFGHPEWIDFPRQGNNWSYSHARRQWSLMDNHDLKYHWLSDFDSVMIHWISETKLLNVPEIYRLFDNKKDEVLAFKRGDYLMVFNFNPSKSFTGYGIPMEPSKYKIIFDTDESRFGGQDRIDKSMTYYTVPSGGMGSQHYLNLYLPSRTAIVLKKFHFKRIY